MIKIKGVKRWLWQNWCKCLMVMVLSHSSLSLLLSLRTSVSESISMKKIWLILISWALFIIWKWALKIEGSIHHRLFFSRNIISMGWRPITIIHRSHLLVYSNDPMIVHQEILLDFVSLKKWMVLSLISKSYFQRDGRSGDVRGLLLLLLNPTELLSEL